MEPQLHSTHEIPGAQRGAEITECHTASGRPSLDQQPGLYKSAQEAIPLCRSNLLLNPLNSSTQEQGAFQIERRGLLLRLSLRAPEPV